MHVRIWRRLVARVYFNYTFLYEIHFVADGRFFYDNVAGLKELVVKFGYHSGYEIRIGVSEKRHRLDQIATVEVYYGFFEWVAKLFENFLLQIKKK